ncbi:unnamed protein product [Calypogeia fissa]
MATPTPMPNVIDFRFLDEGLGGPLNNPKTKRKREAEEEEERLAAAAAAEDAAAMGLGLGPTVHPNKRAAITGEGDRPVAVGKPTYDGVMAGKISGRKWKQPKACRAAALKVVGRKPTLDERNRVRQVKKAYKERLGELKDQIRLNKRAKREQIETRKRIKKENELRTQPVQRITNPKTLKKMSKKQRKLLRIAPD